MEIQALKQLLLYAFIAAAVLGALAHKTNFCTMGAVSDWVNMNKKGRLWAWFVAIAVALIGAMILEARGVVSLGNTLPPYRTANFAWLRYILGGVMFGIGMTLAGGCGNKTLLNIGGGNMKSLFVLGVAGFFAYLMTKTDFYAVLFHSWISGTAINLGDFEVRSQALPHILGGDTGSTLHFVLGSLIAAAILVMAFRDKSFRSNWNNIIGGVGVGLVITAGWYISGGPLGQEVMEAVDWLDEKPLGVGVQSYTFINPMGETLYYLASPRDLLRVTFGVVAVAGVVLGSLAYAVVARRFKLVWFRDRSDFIKHAVGAVLMGIGGVLAMGCSIGQGISGTSTLALGSFMALGSIIFGAALTMKVQYYQMMYEEEASFGASLLSVLVDMRLLPSSLRRLDPP